MSTKEIDRLVQRYLDVAMSPVEEEEFFVRVALDAELRRSYQAQRIVESALRKGREGTPQPSPRGRARLASLTAVAAVSSVASTQPEPPTRATGSSRVPRAWHRDLLVAGATVAVGASLWLGLGASEDPARPSRSDDTGARSMTRPDDASPAAPRSSGDDVDASAEPGPARPTTDADSSAAAAPRLPVATRVPRRKTEPALADSSHHAPSQESRGTSTSVAAPSGADSTALPPPSPVAPPPDTIRVDVRVKMS